MASVSFRKLGKNYGALPIVKDIDLEIADGEFVVFVGPSGCGKSTTLRMLAGLESITSGEIRIGDRVVNTLPPRERDIAMVFQDYALYPHKTVRENMGFSLKVRGVEARRRGETHRRRSRDARHLASARAPARPALRRPAPTSRDGPRYRAPAPGLPVRRAAFEPRRQIARPSPHRDQEAAPDHLDHDHLRHPRPSRGDDPRRPHRDPEGRATSSRSAPRTRSTTARPASSSAASSAPRR